MMTLLTERLLSLDPKKLELATKHPFLKAAGERKLTKPELEAWLTQDRFYITNGYVYLMGVLLQRIPVTNHGPSHPESVDFNRKFGLIARAIANTQREKDFFEEIAKENGLALDRSPLIPLRGKEDSLLHQATQHYMIHIEEMASPGTSWEEAIVFLWAMEEIYLRAWTYALSQSSSQSPTPTTPGMEKALSVLIQNWTSPEFKSFVQELADLVNEIPHEQDKTQSRRLEWAWRSALDLEVDFWETGKA